jgi:hypothetical protein
MDDRNGLKPFFGYLLGSFKYLLGANFDAKITSLAPFLVDLDLGPLFSFFFWFFQWIVPPSPISFDECPRAFPKVILSLETKEKVKPFCRDFPQFLLSFYSDPEAGRMNEGRGGKPSFPLDGFFRDI